MGYKNIFLFALTSGCLIIGGCSSPLVYSSIWQDKPVTIDGKANEWKIPLDYYDDKTKLNYSISNDKVNLYFCIRATETETQRGILRNGLQLFIDTSGGKKKEMGIAFPVIQHRGGAEASGSGKEEPSQDFSAAAYGMKKQYSTTTKQMKITGFPGGINGLSDIPNMYGINAYLNWDTNNIMIYEACIPLKTFYKTSLTSSDSAKIIGISFVITVASKNGGGGAGSHGGDMGGGGMGGNAMGGGMGGMRGGSGGRHEGGGGGSSSTVETIVAYMKLRLVTGPGHM